MSKIKKNVPSVKELEKFLNEHTLKELIDVYSCYDYLIGSSDSLDFLREKYKEYKEEKCKKKR